MAGRNEQSALKKKHGLLFVKVTGQQVQGFVMLKLFTVPHF